MSPCTWEGITCSSPSSSSSSSSNYQVIEISLRSNNMVGTFPTSTVFNNIPTLTALSLEGNTDLLFSFTTGGGVTQPTKLQSIDISKTKFNSFEGVNVHFTQLKEVYAGRAGLIGSFPSELLDISQLQVLDLSFNHMTGELPRDIGVFWGNMQNLILQNNQFMGLIPDSIEEMIELRYVQLGSNKFSGRVPSFANARSIRGVDISNQKAAAGGGLTGPIPSNFMERADGGIVEYVNLSSNYISGELPAILARISVVNMDFTDNEIEEVNSALCGVDCDLLLCSPTTYSNSGRQSATTDCMSCPTSIYWGATSCGPAQTTVLDYDSVANSGNDFGHSEWGALQLLYEECDGDQWNNNEDWKGDDMCNFWGITCAPSSSGPKAVMSILLPSNNLKCTIPAQIFLLPKLETLVLDENQISIDFASIQYAKSLATLSLASSTISSIDGISRAPALRKLDVSNNNFVQLPDEVFQISTLHELYLGPNTFGNMPIPMTMGSLTELRLFECSNCQLSGKIPASISNLKNLVSLNLEDNLLTGPLPPALETLPDLTFLHLSGNFLEGKLLSFRSSTKLRRVDLSNNALDGDIPPDILESVNSDFEYLDLSDNDLNGVAPSILSRLQKFDITDNFITGLESDLCNNACGCDCISCAPGTYNAAGKQDSEANPCKMCSGNNLGYYGQTACSDELHSWDEGVPEDTTSLAQETQGFQYYQSTNPTSIEQEKQALTTFYETCAGQYWWNNEYWVDEDYGHCEWFGIKCHPETGSVLSISLISNNVQCVVKELFDSLPNLSSLSIGSNPLKSFDFSLLELSQSLKELNLDATGISSIEGIHKSPSLEAISLRFNSLPQIAELSMIPSLKSIRVSHNKLTGLPSFDNVQNLQTIIADNNVIGSGGLNGVSFPPNLKFLDLSNNQISSIPATSFSAISSSSGLDIDLADNDIDSLPVELCAKGKWNDGDVGRFGCNGLLCPKGYYSKEGRQTSDTTCSRCPSASFMGATTCANPASLNGSNPLASGTVSFIVIMSIVLCVMLLMLILGVRKKKVRQRFQEIDESLAMASEPRYRDNESLQYQDNEVI